MGPDKLALMRNPLRHSSDAGRETPRWTLGRSDAKESWLNIRLFGGYFCMMLERRSPSPAAILTKRQEREAEWRRRKLEHYKEFMAAANDIIGPPRRRKRRSDTPTLRTTLHCRQRRCACGASRVVRQHAETRKDDRLVRHDELLTKLLLAVREDLGVMPNPPSDYQFRLWSGRRSQ